MRKDGSSVVSLARKIVSFYSVLCGGKIMGNKLSSDVYCKFATGSASTPEELMVLAMVGERFGLQQLDLLPIGVSLPLRHVLDKCGECPPTDWLASAYVLLGREDLSLSCLAHSNKFTDKSSSNVTSVSMSTPYMLHPHPVTIPSSVTDATELDSSKHEDTVCMDGSTIDGMEHIFMTDILVLFSFYFLPINLLSSFASMMVRRLLCSARPVAIQTPANPTALDQDFQQAQLWQLAQRTTALPIVRGAFTLSTTCTLLTEPLPVPKLILAGRLPAQQNATEHESTTVGLMLGLAASYRGTLQPAISKSLYVHIPARHPSSFSELELPTLLQGN